MLMASKKFEIIRVMHSTKKDLHAISFLICIVVLKNL